MENFSKRADKLLTLDLAIVMDCTGSMSNYTRIVRNNINKIVETIVAKETSDVRLALVEYCHHHHSTFVSEPHHFTRNISEITEWLENCSAGGGCDETESVADGLHDLVKFSWRPAATKIAVLILDAPPQRVDESIDKFPDGCPAGLDPLQIARDLAKKEITLYVVGCEPSLKPYKEFFTGLAYITGGQYVPLAGYEALTQIIIGGAREELSLKRLMGEVNREVQEEIGEEKKVNNPEYLALKIYSKLARKFYKVKKLTRNRVDVCQFSKKTKTSEDTNIWTAEDDQDYSYYGFVELCIDLEQVRRLVMKSLGRRKHTARRWFIDFALRDSTRADKLDLAIVMDCTGSMGRYIETARNNIKEIVDTIVAEETDVRLALVEYRDHPPQEYSFVTKPHDFTSKISEMKQWLENCSANGGGDGPEAVADGLHDLLKLSWRPTATKIAILILDAPPHGLDKRIDEFPRGCPAELDPLQIARDLAKKEITLYVVGCEPSLKLYKEFFTGLAYITGGQYVPLAGYRALTQIIIGGAQEELSLEQLMKEVNREVEKEIRDCEVDTLDELVVKIHSKLLRKGYKVKKLTRNGVGVCQISEKAKAYSEMNTMSAASEALKCEENYKATLKYREYYKASNIFTATLYASLWFLSIIFNGETPEDVENNDEFPRYECVKVPPDLEQVKRMVKKSLARNHPGLLLSSYKQRLKLDMAFVVDCTGSMSDYVCDARNSIDEAVEMITATETSDVRVALVEYCYHPPQHSTFVTKSHDFTSNISEMKQWLENGTTKLCGNNLEALTDSLHKLNEMNWRPDAKKIAILLLDAPPHGLDKQIYGFPEGLDPLQLVRDLAKKEITLFVIGCEPSLKSCRNFFMGLAYITGGQYLPLGAYEALTHFIRGGVHEELSLERLMNKINRKVEKEIGKAYKVDDLAKKIHSKLSRKGYKVEKLTRNGVGVCRQISDKAKAYSKMNTMFEVSRVDEDDDDVYVCIEQFLDLEQVKRMVNKSVARKYPEEGTTYKDIDQSSETTTGYNEIDSSVQEMSFVQFIYNIFCRLVFFRT